MEMKLEYKMNEANLILKKWEICSLGDIVTKVGSGITPTGGEKVYKKEGHPFVRSQNVSWGSLLLDDIAFIDEETHSSFLSTEIKPHDVLLNITGASIGRSAVADYRILGGNVNQHVCIIRTDASRLSPYYLNFFLLSKSGQKQIESFQAGGNRQGLNFGQIKSFQIPLPPLSFQIAIASILSDVDALITSLDKLITKKRDIKQATMQQLLTGKTRLLGFSGELKTVYKQTEVGMIPEDWDIKKLREVCISITDGTHYTPRYVNDGIPFYSVENITANNFSNTKFISVKEHNDLIRRCKPEKGDILLTRIGSLGDTKLVDWDINASIYVSLALLKVNSQQILAEYIYAYTKSNQFVKDVEKRSLMNATPIKINMGQIGSIPILCPPLPEQQAIATVLTDMDAEIAALEQRREKTRMLKQGMMQELLTGKTRLL